MISAPKGTPAYWSQSAEDAFRRLQTGVYGLTGAEASRRGLLWATIAAVLAVLVLPYVGPIARLFAFTPLPPLYLVVLAGIVCLYILAAEVAKAAFYRRWL